MFDLSWTHILIVLVVALVVVGPKDLPRMMHTVGKWVGKARSMADQFRKSFDEMTKQGELDELRNEIEALRNERPLAGLASDMHQSILPPVDLAAPSATPPITGSAPQEAAEPRREQPPVPSGSVMTGSAPQEAVEPSAPSEESKAP
ncbi:MAG: Sec-independent protein translocase protein TatB [Rhizomicrobium sp.]